MDKNYSDTKSLVPFECKNFGENTYMYVEPNLSVAVRAHNL